MWRGGQGFGVAAGWMGSAGRVKKAAGVELGQACRARRSRPRIPAGVAWRSGEGGTDERGRAVRHRTGQQARANAGESGLSARAVGVPVGRARLVSVAEERSACGRGR